MNWFANRKLLVAREELLQARIRDLEAQLKSAAEREVYFRSRYERLADEVLFARREIAAPVHVEPEKTSNPIGMRVMRAAGVVGGDMPKKQDHAGLDHLPTLK